MGVCYVTNHYCGILSCQFPRPHLLNGCVIVALLALVWGTRVTFCTHSLRIHWQAGSLGMESDIPDMIYGNGNLSIEGPTAVHSRHLLVMDMGDPTPIGC